jgi:hypothetical protein
MSGSDSRSLAPPIARRRQRGSMVTGGSGHTDEDMTPSTEYPKQSTTDVGQTHNRQRNC